MKKGFYRFLCVSFALFLCTTAFSQNENVPVKVKKNDTNQKVDVPPPPPPPPPVPPPAKEEPLFKVVEDMPRFPGCEDQGMDRKGLEKCAKDKMMEYIFENLKYPEEAKEKKIEGTVVLQFTIAKDGSIEDIKIVRDIGESCGQAAKKVFEKMQSELKWIPGRQRGRAVKVLYTMPVKFKL